MSHTVAMSVLLAGSALVVGLAGSVLVMSAPVQAQLTVEPQSLAVSVPQYTTETQTVTLTNSGSEPFAFCLTFERPLQRAAGQVRLAEGAAGGAPCGTYGEVLHYFDEEDFGAGWGPYGITMTSDGRLFTNESGGLNRTFEFTVGLQYLRSFEHPHVAELTPFNGTLGIAYDTESKTLWWMNWEVTSVNGQTVTRRVLLIEGDFDGVPTGRRIEIAPPEGPIDNFSPGGLSYDPATDLFYFNGENGGSETRAVWAVDRAGTLAEDYPLRPEPYPPPALIGSLDAHGGVDGGPAGTPGVEGLWIEYKVYPAASAPGFDRVAVVDRWGNSEGEALETPVPAELFEAGGAGIRGNPLRSRIDPNGVMYMTFTNFEHTGIVGVRPHPLPPSWLGVDSDEGPEAAWDGELAPGESREVVLTFRVGARAVGEYTASLQAFEAETGEAVEVPLVLTVTKGTDAEDEAVAIPTAASLEAYPNPTTGATTVRYTLDSASDVRLVVYDLLGREVAVLVDESQPPGTHEAAFERHGLGAGVYLVRMEVGAGAAAQVTTRRFTLAR